MTFTASGATGYAPVVPAMPTSEALAILDQHVRTLYANLAELELTTERQHKTPPPTCAHWTGRSPKWTPTWLPPSSGSPSRGSAPKRSA